MQIELDHLNTASTDLDDDARQVTCTGPEHSFGHLGPFLSRANVLLPKMEYWH